MFTDADPLRNMFFIFFFLYVCTSEYLHLSSTGWNI